MNNRLTRAALSLVVAVLSFNCGSMTKADAGTGGGTGGGTGAGGGGGGGVTGGGSGGGGVRTCDVAPTFLPTELQGKAGFDPGTMTFPPYNFAVFAHAAPTAGRIDGFFAEFFANAPLAATQIPAKNYAQCDYCFYLTLGCDNMGANCSKIYLAQSGTLTVSDATKNADAGTYAFTLSNVTFEEWGEFRTGGMAADQAVDGGCLTMSNFAFTGSWP